MMTFSMIDFYVKQLIISSCYYDNLKVSDSLKDKKKKKKEVGINISFYSADIAKYKYDMVIMHL